MQFYISRVMFLSLSYVKNIHRNTFSVLIISPQPDLLPDVFCLMVRILRLMLDLL